MDVETHFRDRIGEDTDPSNCTLCHAVSCFSCVQGYCTALEKVTVGGCVFYKDAAQNRKEIRRCFYRLISHPSRLKTSGTYMCGYYMHYKKCSTHYIRRDELEPAVLSQLRADCAFAREHEDEFVRMVEKKTRRQGDDAVKKGEKGYAEAKKRIEEIDQIINRLYEDKVSGGLSAERFAKMLATYEAEQETLRAKCETLQAQITAARTTSDNAKQFIRVVRKFTEMQELTPEIVATLIERVDVGQAQKVDGVKKQEIKITYNFIGNIQA